MMKKFNFLVGFGLAKRVKTKAFLWANVVMALIVIILTMLPALIATFSSDEPIEPEVVTVYILDDSLGRYNGEQKINLEELFKTNFLAFVAAENFMIEFEFEHFNYDNQDVTEDQIISAFFERDKDGLVLITEGEAGSLAVIIADNNLSGLSFSLLAHVGSQLNRLVFEIIDPHAVVSDAPTIYRPNPDREVDEPINYMAEAIGTFLAIPLFMLITLGFQFIGTDIIEEKSTKSIEIIIASVPPKTHFLSKITAVSGFLVIQLVLFFIYGVIGVFLNSLLAPSADAGWGNVLGPVLDMLAPTLLVTLIVTILGVLLYLVVGAFFASIAVNNEDYQQVQTPLITIVMIGYMISLLANILPPVLVQVLAYIPFISPMLLPVAFMIGAIGWIDVLFSVLILVGTLILVIFLLAPAYRASILSYDQSKLFKRIKNSFSRAKESRQTKKENQN